MCAVARLLLLPVLLFTGLAHTEELYRWVDADGRVHFGDRPPAAAKAEAMEDQLTPLNRADATQKQSHADTGNQTSAQLAADYQRRQQQRAQQQQRQQAAACHNARRQLTILKGRVYLLDDQGREIRISERERQQRAQQLEQQISRVCG